LIYKFKFFRSKQSTGHFVKHIQLDSSASSASNCHNTRFLYKIYEQNNYSIEVSSLRSIQLSCIKYPVIEKAILKLCIYQKKIYNSRNWHMSPAMNEVYHLMETYLKEKKNTHEWNTAEMPNSNCNALSNTSYGGSTIHYLGLSCSRLITDLKMLFPSVKDKELNNKFYFFNSHNS
jgi:hypothetical protein